MRSAVAAISLTVTIAVSGCSGNGGSEGASSDCSDQVRVNGVVYTSYGYTGRKASRHSVADKAECYDVGTMDEAPAGSVFTDNPKQVTTWSFRGYPPEEVLGVRVDKNSFAVFVADSVPDAEQERIYRALRD